LPPRLEQEDPNHRTLSELAAIRQFKADAHAMLARPDRLVGARTRRVLVET